MSGYNTKNRSEGERKIADILDAAGLNYEIEYIFPDLKSTSGRPLRFDFAVFDDCGNVDFLIEYQGEQHYHAVSRYNGSIGLKRQKYNDNMKRKYCLEHNLKLIEIPYYDYNILDYDYIINKIF